MFCFQEFNSKWIYPDSAVYRYVGKIILSGGMPYRDTFDHKGPFLYLIQVAGLCLGTHGIRILECTALSVSFLYIYKSARLLGCGRYPSCLTVFCGAFFVLSLYDGGNMTENFALPFLSVSMYIFLVYFLQPQKVKNRHLVVCGFSFAAVALLKINMSGLWVVMCLGVMLDCICGKKTKELFRYIRWFLLGCCTIAVPVLLWLCMNHSFDAFIQDYIIFNSFYSSSSTQWASLKKKVLAIYETLFFLPVTFSAVYLFARSFFKKRPLDILCLLILALNIGLISISGQTYLHYREILMPLIAYALSVFFQQFTIPELKRMIPLIAVLTLCAFSSIHIVSALRMSNTESMQIAEIVREHSDETDKITVCGNDDSVYLFSNRWSVSTYSYQSPPCFISDGGRSAEMLEEYFHDVETLKPRIIVLPALFPAYDRMKAIANRDYELLEVVGKTEIYLLNGNKP